MCVDVCHRHEGTLSHAYAQTQIHTHTHTHTHIQTFAALRSVVDITSWAIVTFHGSHRVDAFAFVVTAAVVFQALVHVYVHRFVWVLMCE